MEERTTGDEMVFVSEVWPDPPIKASQMTFAGQRTEIRRYLLFQLHLISYAFIGLD